MSFFASCGGQQVVAGYLMIPLCGTWTADLHLASGEQVTGTVPVVIGNLTLSGTVYRSEVYGGQTRVRMVGGAGGWRNAVPAQGYGSSNGVKLSTVLTDVATAAKETVNVAQDQTIGNGFARVAFSDSVASDVLWQFVRLGTIPNWYVDPTGKTQITAWPTVTVTSPFTVTSQKPDQGIVEIATEDYASFLPGCSFTNPLTQGTLISVGVNYVWDNGGKFRFEVLTGSTTEDGDRVLGPIQQVVQKEMAPTRFFGRYGYSITSSTSTTIDCTPKNTKLGLPDLQNVSLAVSSSSKVTPPSSGDCRIEFVDGDPTQPECVWTAQTPTEVDVASGTNPAGYLGAQVQCFFPPVVPFVSTTPPLSGTLTIVSPLTGIISQGSSVAKVPS